MTTIETRTLEVPGASIVYDVRGPLPPESAPVLLMVGQPMTGDGFATLASFFPDRTVVTYDPRGLGRSTRHDGGTTHEPGQQAADLHALVTELGSGPVDLFGSSGGAITGLALVAAHPHDVRTLVAHEPPLVRLLPDADRVLAASRLMERTYQERGWGAAMALFVAMTSHPGELPEGFGSEPPDPAALGLPTADDGSRDDPLFSGASSAVTELEPDLEALRAVPMRLVLAAGVESHGLMTWRSTVALAEALDIEVTQFPSHHGGFLGGEFGQQGDPEAFAARLREVL